ncbi:MAG: type IV secretion system DNA-binding domain-containing protein [Candidatus Peribacteraceae bacterium]|nr:type IV secretion system DNA-binding domain-containing protein [Candidatus Peribacteraceae bacterium]
MSTVFLKVRPALENERGPLYVESMIASLHSFRGRCARVSLEIGVGRDRKIALFVRADEETVGLIESQLYAQFPDIDIEELHEDPFATSEDEEAVSADLVLHAPEIFPIKRHPQFDDMLARVNIDPIAGITSSLARYPFAGMRGHIQIVLYPLGGSFRTRALCFLPLLQKGLPSLSRRFANFYTRIVLARGWRRFAYWPLSMLLGGFRASPFLRKVRASTIDLIERSQEDEEREGERIAGRTHDREDTVSGAVDKVNRLLFTCNIRVSVIAPKDKSVEAGRKVREVVGSFRQFALPHSNAFASLPERTSSAIPFGFAARPFALSVEEVATIWHMPTLLVQTPNIDWVLSKKLEPPVNLPLPLPEEKGASHPSTGSGSTAEQLTILGEAVYHGQRTKFGIRPDDRRRHLYTLGKTGMGKSTLLENMIYSDIQAGRGVAYLDPHGDTAEIIPSFVPKHRSNDVIFFDPADRDFPLSFNVLDCPDPNQRPLVASGLMGVFTKLWPGMFSGRMEHILRNTLLALLEYQGSSMLGIMRMFADDVYRRKVVAKVTDPMVKSFWEQEYASWNDKYRTEATAAIQNKVGQLLSTPLIRNIVGQVKNGLDLRHAMDTGKIIIVNLSKGRLGEDTSAFLGSMLVTKFQIDAMSRADIPESERRDFYLYVDEFQNFATESFASILSEARKYRLNLTMANQYVAQLLIGEGKTTLKDAVFGNVGSIVCFQVGSDDAEDLSLQFEELAMPKDILSLPKYHAYVRLMIDGMPSKPFSVTTLPQPEGDRDPRRVEILRKLSRERYTEKRSVVEEKISKWAASSYEAAAHAKADEKSKEKEEEEVKKAKKKGMGLKEYRAWRDREMWTNEYNSLRKKQILGEAFSSEEEKLWKELEKKLEMSGGVPALSKALQELQERRKNVA